MKNNFNKIELPDFLYYNEYGTLRVSYDEFQSCNDEYNKFLDQMLNSFLNDFLIRNRQSKLINQPNSNDIALFITEYLKQQQDEK